MKQLLIIGLTLISIQSYSQFNLDSTTTWTYSVSNFGVIEPASLYISEDTTINGTKWFILAGDRSCAITNPDSLPYIREENSKWFIFDVNRQTESTLYDFDLVEGESYLVNTFGPDFLIDVRIDSVRTEELNGRNFNVQYCSNPIANTLGFFFAFEVIEGIGSTRYLFPQGNICDPQTGPIRCFSNSNEFVDFQPDRACDETYFPSNTSNIYDNLGVEIYPNPSRLGEDINCTSAQKITNIEIINQSGLIVLSQKNFTKKSIINLSEPGLYIMRVTMKDQTVVKKIIVTN